MGTRASTVVFLLLAAVTGCSSVGEVTVSSEPPAARAAGVVAQPEDASAAADGVAGLELPLDVYTLSAAENDVVAEATRSLVGRCVESFGLPADAAQPLPMLAAADTGSDRHARRYSVTDPEVAARHGYHPPPRGADPRAQFYAEHTETELRVLGGAIEDGVAVASRFRGRPLPVGGCLGQAARRLGAGPSEALVGGEELVSSIQSDAWHGALRDARVRAIFDAWSACMTAAGYDYAEPMDANDDPRWWATEAATPAEIATASADVRCKRHANVVPVWSAVEIGRQDVLVAEHRAALDDYRALLDTQVANARAALG